MKIGERLSSIRKAHGMTQQELAEKLGVSRQTISRWEQMVSEPTSENLIRIGKLFNLSIDALVDDTLCMYEAKSVQKEGDDTEIERKNYEKGGG